MTEQTKRQKALDHLHARIAEEGEKTRAEVAARAKYKIQIWFRSTRSVHMPVEFTLSLWESGKRLHGGGDEMMFVCQRHTDAPKVTPFEVGMPKKAGSRGCGGFIPGGLVQHGMVVCPHCQTPHKSDQIGDSVYFRMSLTKAAEVLADWFRRLGHNADLYAKYHPQDPRVYMMAKGFNARTAREKKGMTIYPLANIIKDTAAGSSLENRFKVFLSS